MTDDQVYAGVEKALRKYFGKRGDRVVQDNLNCVKRGYEEMREVPQDDDSEAQLTAAVTALSSTRVHLLTRAMKIMATDASPPSMNEANERDPYNNNCYGTLVDRRLSSGSSLPILDVDDFNDRIIRGYEEGSAEKELPADLSVARSLIPAGTATLARLQLHRPGHPGVHRRAIAPAAWTASRCAPIRPFWARCWPKSEFEKQLADIPDPADREMFRTQWSKTRKYYEGPAKKTGEGRHVLDHHRPQQVQGLRRVRHRLRRQRAEDDPQDRRGDDRHPQEPSLLQAVRPVRPPSSSTTTC